MFSQLNYLIILCLGMFIDSHCDYFHRFGRHLRGHIDILQSKTEWVKLMIR